MTKRYIVRLTEEERKELMMVIKRNEGSFLRVRRARILLKSDTDGPAWTDAKIAEAYDCHLQSIAGIRRRFVETGMRRTLEGEPRKSRGKVLDGDQEAQIIALRLGEPPEGHSNWTLRLLRDRVIELQIAESVSHQTLGRLLKKRE